MAAEMVRDGLAQFLTAMSRRPLLTAAEEVELGKRMERGDLDAKQRMVEAHLRLAQGLRGQFAA